MRGRRRVTKETIEALGPKLNVPAIQVRIYAEYAGIDGPDAAILRLARGPGFRPDSRWIAATLEINIDEANMAVHRLLRLGLLAMEERDRWVTR